MDDKTKTGSPDSARVNLYETYEVEYWTKALGISEVELERAIAEVGSSASAIRKYFIEHPKLN